MCANPVQTQTFSKKKRSISWHASLPPLYHHVILKKNSQTAIPQVLFPLEEKREVEREGKEWLSIPKCCNSVHISAIPPRDTERRWDLGPRPVPCTAAPRSPPRGTRCGCRAPAASEPAAPRAAAEPASVTGGFGQQTDRQTDTAETAGTEAPAHQSNRSWSAWLDPLHRSARALAICSHQPWQNGERIDMWH